MRDRKIREIEAVIQKRFMDHQFGVDELASQVGISGSRLREIVHAEYGVSPHDLIEIFRIRESIRILVSEDFPTLVEVCKKVGYLNYRTFKRAFKRRVGICPSECISSVKALADIGELSDKLMLRLDSDKKNGR